MGVIVGLHLMPRAVWAESCRRVEALHLDNPEEVLGFIRAHFKGVQQETLCETWEQSVGIKYGDLEQGYVLNQCLYTLATARVFDINKSGRVMRGVFSAFADTRPLLMLLEPAGFDIDLPPRCGPDDSGLFGAWSAKALEPCVAPVQRFTGASQVESLLDGRTLLGRVRAKCTGDKKRLAVETWLMPPQWEAWRTIREAVLTCIADDAYLGWFMTA